MYYPTYYIKSNEVYFYKNIFKYNNETEQFDQVCYQFLHTMIKTTHKSISHMGLNHVQAD